MSRVDSLAPLLPARGVEWLEVSHEYDPDWLAGQYYTDRCTTGDIELRRVLRVLSKRRN